jgi:hypothetical protein
MTDITSPRFSNRAILAGLSFLTIFVLAASGCAQTPAPPTETPTQAITATPLPQATATSVPTAQPTPSASPLPSPAVTPTAIPALAVLENGFDAWCSPLDDAGLSISTPDSPNDARRLETTAGGLSVQIPASACVLVYRFNQAAPQDATLTFFDGGNPFLKLALTPAINQSDMAWTTVRHPYIVNPPLWEVTYQLKLTGPDGAELWSNSLRFARPLPQTCIYGGLPDLLTNACPKSDPWEVEPHPGVKYPYDHDRLLTPQAP